MVNSPLQYGINRKKSCSLPGTGLASVPCFINIENGVFSLASEIKALFKLNHIDRELSPESLSQVYTFWSTITPNTPYKGIYELSPGHCATYNRQGLTIEKFWELKFDNSASSFHFRMQWIVSMSYFPMRSEYD